MKENKLLIILAAIVFVVVVVLVVILSSTSGKENETAANIFTEEGLPEIDSITPEQRTNLKDEAMALFGSLTFLSYDEIMRQASLGRIQLVSELWKLRRLCPKSMEPDQCNLRIRVFLEEHFPEPGGSKLSQLFARYLKYETFMRNNQPPEGLSPTEQYAWIKEQRRKIFGDNGAQLIFGYEESRVDFQSVYSDFLKETEGMSGDQRIAKFQELRKEHFGDYYDALVEKEPAFNRFEIEMELRQDELTSLPDEQQSGQIREIREQYFGKDGADRMAEVDRQIALEQQREKQYREAEADLLASNPGLSETEKTAKLNQLRIEYFGKEEAEAYARREAYKKEMEKLSGN